MNFLKLASMYGFTIAAMYVGIFTWLFGSAMFITEDPFSRPLIFGVIPFVMLAVAVAAGISRVGGAK